MDNSKLNSGYKVQDPTTYAKHSATKNKYFTMNNKQTAVQYLIEQLLPKTLSAEQFYVTQEALKKERQQIEEAFVSGDERGTGETPFNAEQYYIQTYQTK